jgi:hypothetical protein
VSGPADQSRSHSTKWPTARRQQPTFATKSARFGHAAISELSLLSGVKRKSPLTKFDDKRCPSGLSDEKILSDESPTGAAS